MDANYLANPNEDCNEMTKRAVESSKEKVPRPGATILHSSDELRRAITNLLANPDANDDRRVLVAFVGGSAEAFLPDPRRLKIACWLLPGATDAVTLGRLQERGAVLYKSDRLHMKVYWSRRRGCVICSANASGQALGGGTQKEAGVLLPPGVVDIELLWKEAAPQKLEPSDLKTLRRNSDRVERDVVEGRLASTPDFMEWLRLPGRRDWRLGAWEYPAEFAREAVVTAKKRYGLRAPHDYLDHRKGDIKLDDWVLSFDLPKVDSIGWLHADAVFDVDPSDAEAYVEDFPCQAVQFHAPKMYRPPFKIDRAFVSRFRKVVREIGTQGFGEIDLCAPPKWLLDRVADLYPTQGG